MSQSVLSVKVDPKVKKELQIFAQHIGLSVSAIVNNQLQEVLRARHLEFSERLVPNQAFAKELHAAEADVKAGRNLVGATDTKAALRYLKSLPHAN